MNALEEKGAHKHKWIEIAGEGSWTGYGCSCKMVREVDHQDGSEEIRESVMEP